MRREATSALVRTPTPTVTVRIRVGVVWPEAPLDQFNEARLLIAPVRRVVHVEPLFPIGHHRQRGAVAPLRSPWGQV